MKTPHHRHHQLLLSLAGLNCLIIFDALLLINAQQATGNEPGSCYASSTSSTSTCPGLSENGTMIFPFLQSRQCGTDSSLVIISGCMSTTTNGRPRPQWPAFNNGTMTNGSNLNPPAVMGFFNPFNSNQTRRSPFDRGHGLINLTWDESLTTQSACRTASLDQISHYIPNTIDLGSFAHSAFQFSPSNTILLFNCTPTSVNNSSFQNVLHRNTPACTSYRVDCNLQEKDYHCYQYRPSKNLSLQAAMKRLNCKQAMFFVAQNTTALINVSQWSPGLIQLNWSTTGKGWLNSILSTCVGCLQTKGVCGYDLKDDFQCFCANNLSSASNCTATMMVVNTTSDESHTHTGCDGFSCNTSAKIGVLVGATVASVVLLAFCCICTRKYSFRNLKLQNLTELLTTQKVLESNQSFSHLDLDRLTERPIEYRYASIVSATNSFSNVLGEGGFGVVYKGTLTRASDNLHTQIAVKVLDVKSKHSKKQFLNEVATIGRIHHVHVVRLLGLCIQENHEMLVYEYVINGSLDKWLFNLHRGDQNQVLHWEQRYHIAMGIAKGLSYLHEECRHHIVHCDIKPQNILLDGQMCPKIADFGLARLMGRDEIRAATLARGTPGYIAPEMWMGDESQLSTKIDVYSYGMVLLELVSGHRNFQNGHCFPEVAFEAAMRGDFKSIMDVKLGIAKPPDDQSMKMDAMQWQQVRTILLVALWCIQDHPMRRPSMAEVVQYLEGTRAINEQPPRPTIASTLPISAQGYSYFSNHHQDSITLISGGR